MAKVEITTADIAEALRRTLIERTIEMHNLSYTPGPDHEKKCGGYWVSEELFEGGYAFAWDAERSALRVTLTDVPCTCYRVVEGPTLRTAYGIGELFTIFLEER